MEIYPTIQGQTASPSSIYDYGKALGHFHTQLNKIASDLQVPGLLTFYNISRQEAIASFGEEMVESLEEGANLIDGEWKREGKALWTLEPHWFRASEGLRTVQGLLEILTVSPESLEGDESDVEGVVLALQDFQSVLREAEQQGKGFRIQSPM